MNKYFVCEKEGSYVAKCKGFEKGLNVVAEIEAENYFKACRMVEAGEFTTVEEFGGHTEEGYMGATAWVGNKSGHHLYGSELSQAIRTDIRKCGIKGVTVSCKTYSGGQSVQLTFVVKDEDFVPYETWRAGAQVNDLECFGWIGLADGRRLRWDEFMNLDKKTQEEAYKYAYECGVEHKQVNEFYFTENKFFGKALMDKIKKVKRIVDAYNYDDSNGMVDYYDVNFYPYYRLKKVG